MNSNFSFDDFCPLRESRADAHGDVQAILCSLKSLAITIKHSPIELDHDPIPGLMDQMFNFWEKIENRSIGKDERKAILDSLAISH